jgi:hypothetical protein
MLMVLTYLDLRDETRRGKDDAKNTFIRVASSFGGWFC